MEMYSWYTLIKCSISYAGMINHYSQSREATHRMSKSICSEETEIMPKNSASASLVHMVILLSICKYIVHVILWNPWFWYGLLQYKHFHKMGLVWAVPKMWFLCETTQQNCQNNSNVLKMHVNYANLKNVSLPVEFYSHIMLSVFHPWGLTL